MINPKRVDLSKRVEILEAQQQWVNQVLGTYGIRGSWLSPAKAAELLGISRDRIMAEIDRAENMRALGKRGDLIYGVQYRNIQDPEVEQPTWQVHVIEFGYVLTIPPDQRKI